MPTIGQLAKKYNISRSTLLYYSSVGLLCASERSSSNYRIYSDADCRRLEQILIYREAGLPLKIIKKLLSGAGNAMESSLEIRIYELNREISKLREQQKSIIRLLLDFRAQESENPIDWVAFGQLFDAAGFSEYDKWKWHREFEMMSPEKHQSFLKLSKVPAEHIAKLRAWVKSEYQGRGPF